MTTPPLDAVVAGSKGFALALLAPLTERVGTRPRVASDPSQAIALCRSAGALVVIEFQDDASLGAIEDLVVQGKGLCIVAAVPEAHAAAEPLLRAMGVEPARWDGQAEAVLGAVTRHLAARSAEPDVEPARAPSAPPPAAPAPAPAPPSVTTVFPGPVVPPPVLRPAAPGAVAPRAPPPPPVAREAEASAAPPAAAPAPPGSPDAGLFDDLPGQDDFDVDVSDAGASPVPPAFAGAGPWPTNVPGSAEAAGALGRGLAGMFDPPGTPFGAVADVVDSLSDLERAVFAGEPQPVDPEPIRRAAVMRVRVAAALATAPAEGGAVDAGAVSAFLAEIDSLLSDVNALSASAPPEMLPSLEAVRNALVKEAIDFSEASQRGVVAEPAAPAAPSSAASRAAQGTRLVSVASKADTEVDAALDRRRNRMIAVAVVSFLAAAAYHGYEYSTRPTGMPSGSGIAGAPPTAVAIAPPPGAARLPPTLLTPDGQPFSQADLARLSEQQALMGKRVLEAGPGMVVIVPEPQTPTPLQQPGSQQPGTGSSP